jgi:hypothetical protein
MPEDYDTKIVASTTSSASETENKNEQPLEDTAQGL